MLSQLFLHPLSLVSFSFIHWPTLPLICASPLSCHYLRISRGFFSIVSCLLWSCVFLYTPFPFLSLRLLSPAAVPSFRFPFLVFICLLLVRQRLFSLLSSFCLSVLLFAGYFVIPSGSPGVGFALVIPSCAFRLRVLFFLAS